MKKFNSSGMHLKCVQHATHAPTNDILTFINLFNSFNSFRTSHEMPSIIWIFAIVRIKGKSFTKTMTFTKFSTKTIISFQLGHFIGTKTLQKFDPLQINADDDDDDGNKYL